MAQAVAPRAGAWIETPSREPALHQWTSLPARERGSKHERARGGRAIEKSLPARESGSKQRLCCGRHHGWGRRSPRGSVDRNPSTWPTGRRCAPVAPRAGAWIETAKARSARCRSSCRSPRGSVDRNFPKRGVPFGPNSRRSPRGSVDRNVSAVEEGLGLTVAPRAGAWIETFQNQETLADLPVAPRAGAWIETRGKGRTCY